MGFNSLFDFRLPLLYITKMLNLDDITNENNKELNKKWSFIPDDPYRILIIGGSGSENNALLNLIILAKFICMQKI